MKSNILIFNIKFLYIFFIILSLNLFFFSTVKTEGKDFEVNNIDISKPFEINFDKNKVIDEGFRTAFFQLIEKIVNSTDKKKINQIRQNEIKGMIESFSVKEEKFINETYFVKLGVSFNKKKIFNYLEKKNIFPSIPVNKNFLFIPIIIDENKKDVLIFYNNKIFDRWNNDVKSTQLIEYILPTEDLEDLNQIRSRLEEIEKYDFKEIISKYDLEDSIVALIFKNEKEIRILSRIQIKNNLMIKNQSFLGLDLNNEKNIKIIIDELKTIYEDYWKKLNQVNTSIKLNLNIKVKNINNQKILNFEKTLMEIDAVNNYFIKKFDRDFTYYQIIFNGTPSIFLNDMTTKGFNFNTQNKLWVLK